jgi:hypothetical protein
LVLTRYTPNDARADERMWAAFEDLALARDALHATIQHYGAPSIEAMDAAAIFTKAHRRLVMLQAAERRRKVRT